MNTKSAPILKRPHDAPRGCAKIKFLLCFSMELQRRSSLLLFQKHNNCIKEVSFWRFQQHCYGAFILKTA